jgi:hypothetical protein
MAVALVAIAIALPGCKRKKPASIDRVWLGPTGGCVAESRAAGGRTAFCWGALPVTFAPTQGAPTELALGASHGCGVFDRSRVACWGDGADVIPGVPSVPPGAALEVRVGAAHTCVRIDAQVRCFGANAEGQLGPASEADPWSTGAAVTALALGDAHTCVAYGRTPSVREVVVCRGRGFPPEGARLLEGAFVKALAAGAEHTCALPPGTGRFAAGERTTLASSAMGR